jgi:hypothetical protein
VSLVVRCGEVQTVREVSGGALPGAGARRLLASLTTVRERTRYERRIETSALPEVPCEQPGIDSPDGGVLEA